MLPAVVMQDTPPPNPEGLLHELAASNSKESQKLTSTRLSLLEARLTRQPSAVAASEPLDENLDDFDVSVYLTSPSACTYSRVDRILLLHCRMQLGLEFSQLRSALEATTVGFAIVQTQLGRVGSKRSCG